MLSSILPLPHAVSSRSQMGILKLGFVLIGSCDGERCAADQLSTVLCFIDDCLRESVSLHCHDCEWSVLEVH